MKKGETRDMVAAQHLDKGIWRYELRSSRDLPKEGRYGKTGRADWPQAKVQINVLKEKGTEQ